MKVLTVTCVNLDKLFNISEPLLKATEHLPACKPYLSQRVVSPARLGESVFECTLRLVRHYANNCYYYMCMCPCKATIASEKGGTYRRETRKKRIYKKERWERKGKERNCCGRGGIKRKKGLWRETGARTVTNKSPSMTAFC